MSAFDNATKFFHACETLQGWEGCKAYVAEGASFEAQCEPLVDVDSVEAYCDWMAGLGKGPLQGCSYKLNSSSYDESTATAMFFGTFTATHNSDGGPVAPTNRETNTDYVYALTMNSDGKVERMCKIWNCLLYTSDAADE